MRKALVNTKVTVKLRKSVHHADEWYLFIESYPVYKRGEAKAKRVIEALNRTISTPVWDVSSVARILPDGSFNYKPKRDMNGIIQCKSRLDQEACIYADNVRKMRQHEYDSMALYSDRELEIMEQKERSAQDFIKYFNDIIYKRHPNSSDAIIVNWCRVGELLRIYSEGKPLPFKNISVRVLEDIKMFLLRAPLGGRKKGTISRNTASTYFSIVKAGLKQAFIDEFLTVDMSAKVKGIPTEDKVRATLSLEEVKRLAETPCENEVLRRASFFSILTGLRHIDISKLKWKYFSQTSNGGWRIDLSQIKTKKDAYLPISDQALSLCGEHPEDEELLVFAGLQKASWISKPLRRWVEAAGIKKHITFHCFRHSYATLQLELGTDIYTIKSMLGHTNVKTTQIYTHIVDSAKVKAANTIHIDNLQVK
ncbi:MAG: site-specific integrase [Prevotella sp.]|nr:site-specific integrase [Prevotella sp.]